MINIDLFCGTKSFANNAEKLGFKTLTLDFDKQFNPDICCDILDITIDDIPKEFHNPGVIWASPPCQTFSVASIGTHWGANRTPKSEKAKIGIKIVLKTLQLIKDLKPKYFFIENPRGMLRKMDFMKRFIRHTVTYCQYGDSRMKPTDIWTNCIEWIPRKPCKNGQPCHISAPRGSKTGTQGLKGSVERSKVPDELCLEILEVILNNT